MDNYSYFMGRDGFIWWIGVVEDRDDPDLIGRVRVRCLGYHTDDFQDIATDDLPWAHVILPPTAPYGAMHNLTPGMWVMGFWRDPQSMQEPVVIGALPGYPSSGPNPAKGFSDPNDPGAPDPQIGKYKITPDYGPYPTRVGEQDTSRLARGRTEPHPEIAERDGLATSSVPTALGTPIIKVGAVPAEKDFTEKYFDAVNESTSTTWNEPKASDLSLKGQDLDNKYYTEAAENKGAVGGKNAETLEDRTPTIKRRQTEYPYNRVYESESGHIIEIDDTPFAERMYRKHRTGTFQEWDADGNSVTRIVSNNYTIVAGTDFVNVKGDVNLTIDSNCKTYIKGDWDIQVDGNKTETVKGNVIETYSTEDKYTHTTTVNGTRNETVTKAVTETYNDTKTETVTKDVTETYNAKQTTNVTGAVAENYSATQTTNAGGKITITSSPEIDMDAGVINLN